MQPIGDHAIVLGASMAGLAAARALADAYERVTVLERDALPGAAGATPTTSTGPWSWPPPRSGRGAAPCWPWKATAGW